MAEPVWERAYTVRVSAPQETKQVKLVVGAGRVRWAGDVMRDGSLHSL